MSDNKGPTRSTPQLDLMRRLKIRDAVHGELAMPFLEEGERDRLTSILDASVENGITDAVERQAHDFLHGIGLRDEAFRFLTDAERSELASLTSQQKPPPAPSNKEKKWKKRSPGTMSGGEFIATLGVIAPSAVAAYFTYADPNTTGSAIWVAIWAIVCGGSFITDTRHRSATENGSVSSLEGILVAIVWGIAATAVILLGGDLLSAGWAAFLSFIGAGAIGRSILKIKDE